MAVKVGEAYVEIYPRINRAAQQKVLAQMTRDFKDVFNKSYKDSAAADDARLRHSENTDRDVLRSRQHTEEETRRSRNDTDRDMERNHRNALSRAKNEEGAFHRLATQFRTIGTVGRGLIIGSAVLSSWSLLRDTIAVSAKLAPLIGASLAATPAILTGITAEAVILGIAFHGVSQTIQDAFNPKKAKQYKEELQRLAPAARTFVQEIAKLKNLKLPNLQQAFFGNKNVQQTGKNIAPFAKGVAGNAFGVAAASGGALGGITKVATGRTGIVAVNAVLGALGQTIKRITPGLMNFTDGFLDLTRNVAQLSDGHIARGFNKWLSDVGKKMEGLNVREIFKKARGNLKDLISLGKDVGVIFKGIYEAISGGPSGNDSVFKGFAAFIHSIATFVQSGTGKIFLSELSGALSTLSSLATKLSGNFLQLLAGAFAALYPSIKPLADIIARIGKDLVPLGPIIGKAIASAFKSLGQILTALEPTLKKVIGWMADHPDQVNKLAGAVIALYVGFKLLHGPLGGVATLLGGAGKGGGLLGIFSKLGGAGGPILLVVAAVIAVGAAFFYAYKHSKAVRDAVHQLGQKLGELWAQIKGPVLGILGTLVSFFKWYVPIAATVAVKAITVWIIAVTGFIKGLVIGFNSIKNFLIKTVPSWFLKLRDWIVYAYNWVVRKTHSAWSEVINFFTGTIKGFFTKTIPSWVLKFRDWVVYAYNSVINKTHQWWSNVSNFFTGKVKGFFVKTIPDWVLALKKGILTAWDSIFFWTKKKWNAIKTWFTTNFLNFFTKTIPGWGETLRKALLNTWKVLVDNVHMWWKKVWNTIRDTVVGIANKVFGGDGKTGLQKVWNSLFGVVGGLVHMKVANINNTPRMAYGGPVRGAGGPRQDNIPAWLSAGEFVVNAASAKQHRGLLEAINARGYASGGFAVPAIEALQRAVGPQLGVTSTTGGGHAAHSYHYRGMAVDFSSGSKRAMDVAAANLMKFSSYILELIHSPNWFVKNYHPTGRGTYASVYAAHFNHVHLAMTKQAAEQALKDLRSGKIKRGGLGFGPGGLNLPALVEQIHKSGAKAYFKPAYSQLAGIPGGKQPWHGIAKHPIDPGVTQVNKAVADMVAQAAAQASVGGAPTNLGAGPHGGQIKTCIAQASRFANIPANWVQGLMYIISRESGGNPRAYNPTPVGREHAEGIMQTLPSTFRRYHARSTSNNIYDPVANIAAAVNYIHGRYGTVFNTPWLKHTGNYYAHGGSVRARSYDQGGVLQPGWTAAYNGTGKNEYVGKGFPEKLQVVLRVDEFTKMMDTRIAKHDNDLIQYIETR